MPDPGSQGQCDDRRLQKPVARLRHPAKMRGHNQRMDMPGLIDLPPVWLAGAIALVAVAERLVPYGTFGPWAEAIGLALILAGLVLMLAAVVQMVMRRTTVVPRQQPKALVSGGVFRISRNPIYLGDAMILTGVVLWRDVPLAAPVVFAFIALIQNRFILPEEGRLRAAFGAQFDAYAKRTRRWL